jgi:hypothetical protein
MEETSKHQSLNGVTDYVTTHALLTEQSEVNIVDLAKHEKQSFLGKSRLRFNLEVQP